MRTKKVNRYWCDFCSKAGLQAGAMRKHEQHCTMNPARSCRVCALLNGGHGLDMGELLAILPDPTAYLAQGYYDCNCGGEHRADCTNEYTKLDRALKEAMPKLREAVDNCPACILAALRQKKIPVPMVEGFDFTGEMKAIWADINASREPQCGYDY
jgi:hypothetical protein